MERVTFKDLGVGGKININTDLQHIVWLCKSVQEKVFGSYKYDNSRRWSINVEDFLTTGTNV